MLRKLIDRQGLDATYCMAICGNKDNIKRRAERYISSKEDLEYDTQALTFLFFNANPTLTENERRIAYACHRNIINFYKNCLDEMVMDQQPDRPSEKYEPIVRPD